MAMATAYYPKSEQSIERSLLGDRAERQAETMLRIRCAKALEKLEAEARKMLQLEEELGAFANQYYEAVGAYVERLTLLEQQLANFTPEPAGLDAMPAVLAQKHVHASRRNELKKRYRNLAKEIHPDRRAHRPEQAELQAAHMHTLNASYQKGDLAGLLRLEAELILGQIARGEANGMGLDSCLREIERAAETYAEGYRNLLSSPLNELMLRAMSARLAGWNWLDAVVARVRRNIEEKERALVSANIAAITQWREDAQSAVA